MRYDQTEAETTEATKLIKTMQTELKAFELSRSYGEWADVAGTFNDLHNLVHPQPGD